MMFFLIWASLLLSMRGSSAQDPVIRHCEGNLCISIPEGDITAEPGSRVVIPCTLTNTRNPDNLSENMIWYKCDPNKRICSDSQIIFRSDDSNVGQSRVSALEPNTAGSCGIVINDVTASDSGSYQVRFDGFWRRYASGYTFKDMRVVVSIRDPVRRHCEGNFCIILPEGNITAEPGSRVVIPCTLTNTWNIDYLSKNMTWYKCDRNKRICSDSEIVFRSYDSNAGQSRVSALEPNTASSCAIVINDVTTSDSGSYQVRVGGFWSWYASGFTFKDTSVVVSVRVNRDDIPLAKPKVKVSPVADGEETTLTCTAPGDCSGSAEKITWTFPKSITNYREKNVNNCISELTFNATKKLDGTKFICRVGLPNNITTERTVTLEVPSAAQPGELNSALPWIIVAVVSLAVNVVLVILLIILWNTRNKVKPNQEDRVYMSLDKPNISQYDIIVRPPN